MKAIHIDEQDCENYIELDQRSYWASVAVLFSAGTLMGTGRQEEVVKQTL